MAESGVSTDTRGGGAFIVGLEFTEIEIPASGRWQFYADLLTTDKDPRIHATLSEQVVVPGWNGPSVRERTAALGELPGVATFFVSGSSFTLPPGFGTTWRTRGPSDRVIEKAAETDYGASSHDQRNDCEIAFCCVTVNSNSASERSAPSSLTTPAGAEGAKRVFSASFSQ